MIYNYTNLTTSFKGMGFVLVDYDSLVVLARKRLKSCSSQAVKSFFTFFDQNLKNSFRDVRYLRGTHDYSIENIQYKEIDEENNISFILISEDFNIKEMLKMGYFVSTIESISIEIPYIYGIVYNIDIYNKYSDTNNKYSDNKCSDNSDNSTTNNSNNNNNNSTTTNSTNNNNNNINIPFNNNINLTYNNKDLKSQGNELLLNLPKNSEFSLKHLQNIIKSANSLYIGPTKRSSSVSVENKIVRQNKERLKKLQLKEDNLYLKNISREYHRLSSNAQKKEYLASIKIKNKYIEKHVKLLRIELNHEIWALAPHSSEEKLLDLYIEAIEYIEDKIKQREEEKARQGEEDNEDINFVFEVLEETGFKSTVAELKHRLGVGPQPVKKPSVSDKDIYFQLRYCGKYLKRTLGTKKDPRVLFEPDQWQITLLDAIDLNRSVVISAPTSSGKTFICYYVIDKILKENKKNRKDQGIAIFCLPTKALVNQVSADIYARYSSHKENIQGTLMHDRCNELFNCQVLITIPSMLEIILKDQNKERYFQKKIKYIILDEIHKINDSELNLYLERIIHLSRCPLVLLSATIGNLPSFFEWFRAIEKSKGREAVLVTHKEKYCEHQFYVYDEKDPGLVKLNMCFAYSVNHLKEFGFGNDIHFLPHEILNLYYFMYLVLPEESKKLIKKLKPKKFFESNLISKRDVKRYEEHLLETFEGWVRNKILKDKEIEMIYRYLTDEANLVFKRYSEKYKLSGINEGSEGSDNNNNKSSTNTSEGSDNNNKSSTLNNKSSTNNKSSDNNNTTGTSNTINEGTNTSDTTSSTLNNKSSTTNTTSSTNNKSSGNNNTTGTSNTSDNNNKSSTNTSEGSDNNNKSSTLNTSSTLNNINNKSSTNTINTTINTTGTTTTINTTTGTTNTINNKTSDNFIFNNLLNLCLTLQKNDLLPVIIFNTDRDLLNKLVDFLYSSIRSFDVVKRDKSKEKLRKELKKKKEDLDEKNWKELDSIQAELDKADDSYIFNFLDSHKVSQYEIQEIFGKKCPKFYLNLVNRGIGIHSDSINSRVKMGMEILFRKKHIKILFATETLALGINMPCRSVVFCGDSLKLDPINFKQMCGRAGRRGFDLLGNVIFYGIGKNRVKNLMVSNLPELQGGYILGNSSVNYRGEIDMEKSIVKSPLFVQGASKDPNEDKKYLFSLSSRKDREDIFLCQKKLYPFISKENYLSDLFITNRNLDPSIYVLGLLIDKGLVRFNAYDFFNVLSHLFCVIPVDRFSGIPSLPGLGREVEVFLAKLNEDYIRTVGMFYSRELQELQSNSCSSLLQINSFLFYKEIKKNSYILDFLLNSNQKKIKEVNKIDDNLLWKNLFVVDNVIKNVIGLIKRIDPEKSERLKKLQMIYSQFTERYKGIFA